MTAAEFADRFGSPDLSGALCGYTRADDTRAVLTLLCHATPRRVLEIGTALGQMTANLTRWTPHDAVVFTLDVIRGMPRAADGAVEQQVEVPTHSEWGRFANHFGTAHKAFFITADTMTYDFGRLTPLEFVFVDGAHDLQHVLNDSRKAYDVLVPGGWLVWHDFGSPVPWVKVREAIEQIGFVEPVVRIEGTEMAFLRKGQSLPAQTAFGRALTAPSSPTSCRELSPPPQPPASCLNLSPPPHPPFGHPLPAGAREIQARVRVVWEGDFEGLHSLGLVNRAVCRELLRRGHDLGLIGDGPEAAVQTEERLLLDPRLTARLGRGPIGGPAQVRVRHRWPPRLEPPPHGCWVLMQPWEYGSLPKAWLPMLRRVDEVWAYSRDVRQCYVEAGVPSHRVHVAPLGGGRSPGLPAGP